MKYIKLAILTLSIILFVGTPQVNAVPAYQGLISYRQSDGTIIKFRIIGDEYENKIISEDGYTLLSGTDGNYYFAEVSASGLLVVSKVMAKPLNELSSDDAAYISKIGKGVTGILAPSPMKVMQRQHIAENNALIDDNGELTAPVAINSHAPRVGDVKSIVLLVEFKDKSFSMDNPQQAFTDMLNKEGYSENEATGSARDFYLDASTGLFNPEFVVAEPVKLPENASYYGGYYGTDNALEMAVKACELADEFVDFSQFADDGIIRDIFIFFAGHNKAEGATGTVWPHRFSNSGQVFGVYDGCNMIAYACSSELRGAIGNIRAGIGTFCHEFGHVLGWPDFYDTNGDTDGTAKGLDFYSLMANGGYLNEGRTPISPSILERWMCGWATPEIIRESGDYEILPVAENQGYIVECDDKGEYFMLDYRDSEYNVWDKYIGNTDGTTAYRGLLVTHVDYTTSKKSDWPANLVNSYSQYELAKLLRSGTTYTADDVLFPGVSDATALTGSTNADYIAWSKAEVPFEIHNIKAEAGKGSFIARSYEDVGEIRISINLIINSRYRLDIDNTPDSATVKWYSNDTLLEDNKVTIDQVGTHTITAVVTLEDGSKHHIIKYFVVE